MKSTRSLSTVGADVRPMAQTLPGLRRSRWDIMTPCWDVLGAGKAEPKEALAVVCRWYWYPVWAFIRSLGVGADAAKDVTQGFFTGLLERNDLARLDPARGRFRCWLRTAARRHLYNEFDRAGAEKRGRDRTFSIDSLNAEQRMHLEPRTEHLASDELFDRRWAMMVAERSMGRLRESYAAKGKAELFAQLEATLSAGTPQADDTELGARLGKSPGAVRQERHRMRSNYRRFLRHEVSLTVRNPAAVEEEMRELFTLLAREG